MFFEIYINQSGANVEVTIVQDGQNNRISTKSIYQNYLIPQHMVKIKHILLHKQVIIIK